MADLGVAKLSYPGDEFVSIPFNAVVFTTLGVLSVHNRRIACLISIIAFSVCILAINNQEKVYEEAAWKQKPAADVSQTEVTEYLSLSLCRWIASFLFSVSLIKVLWRLLPIPLSNIHKCASLGNRGWIIVGSAVIFALHLVTARDSAQLSKILPISRDWAVYCYFHYSRLAEYVCLGFQVAFLLGLEERITAMKKHQLVRMKAHIFMCSFLMLALTFKTFPHPCNYCDVDKFYARFNISVQLLTMIKTWKDMKSELFNWSGSLHDLLHIAVISVPWLFSTLVNVTFAGIKSTWQLILFAITACLQISRQKLLLIRNSLQIFLTEMKLALTCFIRGFTIVGTQFVSALERYSLHWQENDYELLDEEQVVEQPNQATIIQEVNRHHSLLNLAHCESCDNLDQQLLIYQRSTLSPIRSHVSETVLAENEISTYPTLETCNPIVEDMIPQQTQTSLEVIPLQESNRTEMVH